MAKEATDNGQIVEDSPLTDQAIFDRLERDVAFRSVATRLVQRYGHLLPSFSPDSELGKQQELLLKERARRIVQIEAQEDSESPRPRQGEENEVRRAESKGVISSATGPAANPSPIERGSEFLARGKHREWNPICLPCQVKRPRPAQLGHCERA